MKRTFTFILASAISFGFSQTGVNNLSFESWTNFGGPSPSGFVSLGATQMTTGAQHLNSYVRLTSNGLPASHPSTSGAMQLGSFAGTNVIDGAPYMLKPLNLTGYYKCSLVGTDTAYIAVDLTKNGVSILTSSFALKITSSTNSWTFFSVNLTYSGNIVPDSIHIYATANQSFAGVAAGQSGTTLDVDNFGLVMNTVNIPESEIFAVDVYPVPAKEKLFIKTGNKSVSKVEVRDLNGRLLTSQKSEGQKIEIKTNDYAPGIYFYKLYDEGINILKTGIFAVSY